MSSASKEATDSNREPGAPFAPGAIDPELVNLRKRRQPVGAVAAGGVVVLALFMFWRLWPDLTFARQGDLATPVTASVSELNSDAFVELRARLAYGRAQRVRSSAGSLGMRLVPVAGASGQLWVAQDGSSFGQLHESRYAGRVRRLDDVSFGEALRERVGGTPAPRYVTAKAWREATTTVRSVDGDDLTPKPTDAVEYDLVLPDRVLVQASYNDQLPNAGSWSEALAATGLVLPGAEPTSSNRRSATFDVTRPGGVRSVAAILDGAKLWGVGLEEQTDTRRTTVAELRTSEAVLGAGTLPDDALLRIWTPTAIPADAWVVLVGEQPGDYWYMVPVAIVLGLIALLFGWACVRAIRRDFMSPKVTPPPSV